MKKILLFIFIVVVLFGCDAPRLNPLDPNNPNSGFYSISGKITGKSPPFTAIENSIISYPNENIFVYSDRYGNYSFDVISPQTGWLIVEKNGYNKDSVFIDWNNSINITRNFFLDSNPVLVDGIMSSIIEYKVSVPNNTFISRLEIKVRLADADGSTDIDSVLVINEELEFSSLLLFNFSTGYYEKRFTLNQLSVESLEEIIGKTFTVIVTDLNGKKYEAGTVLLNRVITKEIKTISPILASDTVSNPVKLRWIRFDPGFSYFYFIEIYTNETPPELVFQNTSISSDSISYSANINLTSGQEYFWVIWAQDDFFNRTRSIANLFTFLETN